MISIVIPTYNEEKIIKDTLSRLKRDLTLSHELIVSDGKSTDKTVEIARQLADKVVVHDKPTRQKISEGRNAGAKVAQGEYILFLDADCRLENPDKVLTTALQYFKDHPNVVAQAAWIKVFPEGETFADKIVWACMNTFLMCSNLIGSGTAAGEFQLMKKETFEKVHGFREDLVTSEDVNMFNRLSKIGKTRLNPRLVVYHSGRHGHTFGWPKLLWIWLINTLSYLFRGKSYSKEWSVIR